MVKKLMLMLLIVISKTALANNNFIDIAAINDRAQNNSKLFNDSVDNIIRSVDKLAQNADFDKESFVKLQKNLLNKYYRNNKKDQEIIVFISFSMPDVAIKNIIKESTVNNASVVINGFYNDSMKETLKKLSDFINNDNNKGGIEINPNLFEDYQIKSVPAYVFKNKDTFDVIYGASNITHAADVIKTRGYL